MEPEGSRRTPNRFDWVLQLALSSVCFALWTVVAADYYPWSVTGGIAAVSLVVGFIFIPRRFLLAKPKKGFVLSFALVVLAVGTLSAWALLLIAPDLLYGVLVATGGLWFSTSVRGTLASWRP